MDDHGEVQLRKVTSVVDTGIAVNPDIIVAQLQGGLIFGLTAALFGEITIDQGRVRQSNFNDYRMLRIDEVPPIEVHVVKSTEDPGGIGETGCHRRPAGAAQRDLCRDRRRTAPAADRSRRPGGSAQGVNGMRSPTVRKTIVALLAVVIVVVIGAAIFWHVFDPGPMAFAGGTTVALPDYHAADPTGVPADLKSADLIKRGEYLARAADCVVCHTSPGGEQYAGGLAIPLPFGTLYSTNITPDKATGIGDYSDADFLNAMQRGIRRDGTRLYPAMPYPSYTYMTDARRACDQGLSVQPCSGVFGQSGGHAGIPIQSALADEFLVVPLQ